MAMTRAGERVLVVDDEEAQCLASAEILREAGYEVETAFTVRACFAALEAGAFDLILLDVALPDGDGFEVCARVKQEERWKKNFVLFISGTRMEEEDLVRGLEAGAEGYLIRPVSGVELKARVDSLMRIRRFERASRIELERSREQFELAVRGSRDGIWDWNLRDGSLFISAHWKSQIGYREDELANDFASFQTNLHPEDWPRVKGYVDRYLAGEISSYELEFRMRHKDGSYRWILARGEAIRNEDGLPVRMAGSHTDITERKKLEEERFNAIEKDAMLGRLAATVAHEVNNPLFAIKMQAETLKKRLAGDEAETGKVSLILDQVDRIARTVKGLLGLARRRDEGDSAVDLGAMIRNVLLLYDVGFVARNIRIRLELPAAPILIRANGDRIQQVFINLIENARQMITSGGEIGIVLRAVGNEVELTVEDNGPGFSVPAETLFAPDFSLRPGGTGLGLAIARRIVEEHAGAITAENRAEGGARFKVILPIKDREGCS